jgi:hypothetical protein
MAIQTVKTGSAINDGTGDDARTAFTKINQNFTYAENAASRQVGTADGNVMEVGAFGLGRASSFSPSNSVFNKNTFFAFGLLENGDTSSAPAYSMGLNISWVNSGRGFQILSTTPDRKILGVRWIDNGNPSAFYKIWNESNAQKDSNGFLKAASPIVQLFTDKIELNDEAQLQPITFEKLGVGDYLIKGSTGFAQEGWYIEMPKDANGNVLAAVIYEQLANGDISVKTYDYMLNKKGRIVPDLKTPLDIPENRWIDIRLQALPQSDIAPTDNTVATNAE